MKFYAAILIAVFAIFIYNSIVYRKRERQKLKEKIKNNWGSVPQREYEYEELKKITFYFQSSKQDKFFVDDITWNDLDMDSIFMLLNNTYSSAGEEYLYKILRIPEFDKDELKKREALTAYFMEHEEDALRLQEIFAGLGRTRSISLLEFIHRLNDVEKRNNLRHIICDVLFLASVVLLFAMPLVGIISFFVMLIINIGTYYNEKASIESYFTCFKYLADMTNCADAIVKSDIEGIAEYKEGLKQNLQKLSKIRKGISMISLNGNNGSIGEIIMEYVRMIFHVDIMSFNSMMDVTLKNIDTVDEMFETFGRLETGMAIASFRLSMPYYCVPEFETKKELDIQEMYHPMISEPVANDLTEAQSVLITGSNASGKSTFLKTVAINAILAQSIHTCTAKAYKTCFFRVYTSMALRDDLMSKESYFIVEIKSLKRIMDAVNDETPILCFVDEVLRGTNTVERIAASFYILDTLRQTNALCFAATHDIELTNILENAYSNYHFTEDVKEDDVLFSYKIMKGRATSRNAIKLLNIIGFDKEIVGNAEKMANRFIKEGIWEL